MKRKLLTLLLSATIVTALPLTAFAADPIPEEISEGVLRDYYERSFDAASYAEKNPNLTGIIGDSAEAYLNHYLACGISEGRRTGKFDCVAFVWNNREWFRQHGLEKDNPFFNAEKYRKNNPDLDVVYGDDMQAYVEHYITFGITEGRSSESSFDILAFSKDHPDTGVRTNAAPEEILRSYRAETAKNNSKENTCSTPDSGHSNSESESGPGSEETETVQSGLIRPIPLYMSMIG